MNADKYFPFSTHSRLITSQHAKISQTNMKLQFLLRSILTYINIVIVQKIR